MKGRYAQKCAKIYPRWVFKIAVLNLAAKINQGPPMNFSLVIIKHKLAVVAKAEKLFFLCNIAVRKSA